MDIIKTLYESEAAAICAENGGFNLKESKCYALEKDNGSSNYSTLSGLMRSFNTQWLDLEELKLLLIFPSNKFVKGKRCLCATVILNEAIS